MSEDINYCESSSIYTENGKYAMPATSPSHMPCPDMQGLANYDPEKTKRARFLLSKLREKHGLIKHEQPEKKTLSHQYKCNEDGCFGPLLGNKDLKKPNDAVDERWRARIKEKALRLSSRVVRHTEPYEAA